MARIGPRRLLGLLGPGFVTGASDDDPSGICTYAQAGAAFGFATLWMAPVSFVMMAGIQYITAKIGLVAGMGLAGVLRTHYPRWLLYLAVALLVVANTINAGVDVGAIAAAINLLAPALPASWLILPIGALILALQVWGTYDLIQRTFKWLGLVLLAYIASALFAPPDWHAVLVGTLVPSFRLDTPFLMTMVALLGTTISPYLFFWQASQEVEEEKALGRETLEARQGASNAGLSYAAWDVNVGMFFSNLVMYFIILATAATLHVAGRTDIQTATQAAEALRPLAGNAAGDLLAFGLIGSGFLAVPVLTSASAFAVCESFGWQCSLDAKLHEARRFYGVIVASTLVGLLINYVGLNPIKALVWTAVLNGLLAPPIMVLIMLVANDRRVMGERVNGGWINLLGWAATVAMFVAAIALVLGLAGYV